MWSTWDKQSEINGRSAEWVLNRHTFLQKETTIFIRTENGRVTNIEGKSILAELYGIDPTLPDDEFIAEYERIINLPPEPAPETDTTTYAELAQVYAEGVNSIE